MNQRTNLSTAFDDCTRFRVLRLYRHLNHRSSLSFFRELRDALPFPIRKLQCDNGTEFPLQFSLTVQAAGIRHRYINRDDASRTARSSAVTVLTTKSSGSANHSRRSMTRPPHSRRGSVRTTTSAFPWRSVGIRLGDPVRKACRLSAGSSRVNRGLILTRYSSKIPRRLRIVILCFPSRRELPTFVRLA